MGMSNEKGYKANGFSSPDSHGAVHSWWRISVNKNLW